MLPFKSCHAPSIIETSHGNVLCAFFAGEEEGAEGVGIFCDRFSNGIWDKPRPVYHEPKGRPCWNPVLFQYPDGEILLFFKVGLSTQSWSGCLMRSKDEGKTWSELETLPAGIMGPVKNHPLLIDDTLLCGTSVESYQRWGCFVEWTRDRGKSFERSLPINLPDTHFGMIQPSLTQLADGSILLLARTKAAKFIAKSLSKDGGYTWSPVELTDVPNPNSSIEAIRLTDGRLLMAYNHSSEERSPLNVALSSDEGTTWTPHSVLEVEEGEFSYPSVIQLKSGQVMIAYSWQLTKIKEVLLNV
ncbi:MAG: hypothetical protein SP1CHLAM54_14550 [Chlamydiia bacterium]|nr:hypothetical protein [Chlamydiia bacterium]MCH9616346.1 hypothetical protein [Chlamydiia bacterium]MCH9629668.1 hypothetical protein [Chlamydiia bacterium]